MFVVPGPCTFATRSAPILLFFFLLLVLILFFFLFLLLLFLTLLSVVLPLAPLRLQHHSVFSPLFYFLSRCHHRLLPLHATTSHSLLSLLTDERHGTQFLPLLPHPLLAPLQVRHLALVAAHKEHLVLLVFRTLLLHLPHRLHVRQLPLSLRYANLLLRVCVCVCVCLIINYEKRKQINK